MKKIIAILLSTVLMMGLAACGEEKQETKPVGPQYTVTLQLNCEKNLLLSRYDVDVYVDEEKIATLEHGESHIYQVEVGEGVHSLKVTKENDESVDGATDFMVSGDMELVYDLTCSMSQVEIAEAAEEDSSSPEGEDETEESGEQDTSDENTPEAVLEKTFPQENARRAAVVAVTNFKADDIYLDDRNTEDPEKFHSYADVSGFYMTIYEDGTWSAADEHTWHVENLILEVAGYGSYCKAALDVRFDGENYIIDKGTVIQAILEYLDSDDPAKINEEELYDPESHPCLVVSPEMIRDDRSAEADDAGTADDMDDEDEEDDTDISEEENDFESQVLAQRVFEEYGKLYYPYGFKCHWFTDLRACEKDSQGVWFFKVGTTIKNEYGAKADTVAEGKVDLANEQVIDFYVPIL